MRTGQTIGARLGQARAALGMKQTEVAEAAGLSIGMHKKYETDVSAPGSEAVAGYVRAGISANYLVAGEGPMLLKDCITVELRYWRKVLLIVEEYLDENDLQMPSTKKLQLVDVLVKMFPENEQPAGVPAKDKIEPIIKLAA